MADTKITQLQPPQVGYPVVPATDVLPIVVIADPGMATSGSTRKVTVNQLLGAGGTATLASATITGDLTVDTSTLKVDSTNNRVGIGTATPGAYALDVKSTTAAAQLRISGSNQNSITFGNAAGGASNGFLMGRSFSSDDANNLFVYDLANSALRFFIGNTGNVGIGTPAPTEAVDLNSGNLKLTNGNVVLGTSGKGIDFSATTSGSGTMTSELLNDYEEGTWTIGLTFGSLSVGITTSASTGRYTKIGRQVTVSGLLNLTSKGSSTGIAEIQGLPFTIANGNEAYSAANVRFNGVSFADVPISIGATNSTKILLQEITNAGVVTDLTDADFSNSSQCIISFTYTV
jgi:hypothetical protein